MPAIPKSPRASLDPPIHSSVFPYQGHSESRAQNAAGSQVGGDERSTPAGSKGRLSVGEECQEPGVEGSSSEYDSDASYEEENGDDWDRLNDDEVLACDDMYGAY